MKTQTLIAVSTAIFLSACQMGTTGTGASVDPLDTALRGKTLTNVQNPDVIVNLNADGALTGTGPHGALTGSWSIENGQYCRTILTPDKWKGSACQDVEIDGNTANFIRADGSSSSYTMS